MAEVARGLIVVNEPERLAWVLLHPVNRTQAKGIALRVVVPRDREMAYELDPAPAEDELPSAEEYLWAT